MTHSGGQPHTNVGDRGQRYEVSYQEDSKGGCGPRKVLGWSDELAGARQMVRSIELHPSMHYPHILDRTTQLLVNLK